MLLIGMKISFTKNPTNPITTNPIAVRKATLVNSTTPKPKEKINSMTSKDWFNPTKLKDKDEKHNIPLRSGLWHLLTRRTLSLANSLNGSNTESTASIFFLCDKSKGGIGFRSENCCFERRSLPYLYAAETLCYHVISCLLPIIF